tara:strand:+ start:63 stop:476 length:414 start_codon:yes stop_codon:yes gene_type:complete
MNIHHEAQFDTAKVIAIYEKKDGVPITYICTTDISASDVPMDVFYRATPHPEFGNRYFGLYYRNGSLMITSADKIEELEFGMIEVDGKYYYSQSHHDYKVVEGKMIDGGRAYIRCSGRVDVFKIQDGKFVKHEYAEE